MKNKDLTTFSNRSLGWTYFNSGTRRHKPVCLTFVVGCFHACVKRIGLQNVFINMSTWILTPHWGGRVVSTLCCILCFCKMKCHRTLQHLWSELWQLQLINLQQLWSGLQNLLFCVNCGCCSDNCDWLRQCAFDYIRHGRVPMYQRRFVLDLDLFNSHPYPDMFDLSLCFDSPYHQVFFSSHVHQFDHHDQLAPSSNALIDCLLIQ